jgi:hypothetical protein
MQLAAEIVEEGSKTLSPKHISLSLNALKGAPPLSGATQNLFRSALRRLRGLIASSRPGELREAFTPQSLAMIANAYCSLDGVYSADMKEAVSLMSTAALSFEVGCFSPPFAGGIVLTLPCFDSCPEPICSRRRRGEGMFDLTLLGRCKFPDFHNAPVMPYAHITAQYSTLAFFTHACRRTAFLSSRLPCWRVQWLRQAIRDPPR